MLNHSQQIMASFLLIDSTWNNSMDPLVCETCIVLAACKPKEEIQCILLYEHVTELVNQFKKDAKQGTMENILVLFPQLYKITDETNTTPFYTIKGREK